MGVLVFGNSQNFHEVREKLGAEVLIDHESDVLGYENNFKDYELILDFTFDEQPEIVELYGGLKNSPLILLNSVKTTLAEAFYIFVGGENVQIAGFNGLPGFVNRDLWEITSARPDLDLQVLKKLGINWEMVDDRVGMVAPRVISMIINEAYFTVQEGTADRESIDQAMKLGTGYPYGPFEWASRIGLENVYELLDALYQDTRDERYKIAPLLKKEYLKG
jgi:3-hydroxybutyryl-CoA dehydrogenase